jgi:hypothetical protein
VMFRELSDHPERIQKALDDMTATWRNAQGKASQQTGH